MHRAKITAALVVLSLLVAPLAGAAPPSAGAATPSAGPAVRATDSLALAMLKHLAPGANAVVSPYSVQSALAMVDQGAGGQTAQQLDALLGGAASPATLAAANRLLTADLHSAVTGHGAGGPTLDAANGLWAQQGLSLAPPFSSTLSRDFGAAAQQTNFADPAGAIQTINGWVSQHTGGLIPSLMSPSQVSPTTQLVLANAVYLNARWQTPFDPNRTAKGPFSTAGGPVSVPFMHGLQLAPYASGTAGTRYQAVALPYAHSSLELLAVMPPAGALDRLETSLSLTRLSSLASALHTRNVNLSMPRFSLSFKASLNDFLQSQGVTQAFGDASRLDRIVRGRSLKIEAVEHAALLKVAEKGTVAAAATGISVEPTAAPIAEIQLSLNHPFLIFLRDSRTGAILFAGRVENPSGPGR